MLLASRDDGGLIVGREARNGGRLQRYRGEAHLLTFGPTHSGRAAYSLTAEEVPALAT
jgi:hypothetical protein